MEKLKIQEAIVVEGKHDAIKIKEVVEGEVLITNGSHIASDFISLAKAIVKVKGLIIFTDPDSAGAAIRKKLADQIPEAKHAVLVEKQAKIGVEHASKEAIIKALEHAQYLNATNIQESISLIEMLDLGLMGGVGSASKRAKICNHLYLPKANAKQLHRYLGMLNITKKDIEMILWSLLLLPIKL